MYNSDMRNKRKKILGIALFTAITISSFLPLKTSAFGVPGFSGYPAFTPVPCVCSASIWSFHAPLWLSIIPIAGPMVYVPYATIPYPYFAITIPATSQVGAYLPGVQACWQYVGVACVLIPSIGVEMWTGTGVPGASI